MNTCIEVNNNIDCVPDNIHETIQSLIVLNNNKIKKKLKTSLHLIMRNK